MAELEDNFNSLIVTNVNDVVHADTLLKTIGYGLSQEKYCRPTIAFINKLLAGAVTRDKGFGILHKILADISTEVLKENCASWANYALSHHPSESITGTRLQFLVQLLGLCRTNQDFQKCFVSNLLSKIVEACINVHKKSSEAFYSLDCLITCMKLVPSPCVVYKKKMETYALSFLDSPASTSVLDRAAKCLHYTNQVGGGGLSGTAHIKNFNDTLIKLCNTLSSLHDRLFENVNEFENFYTDTSNVFEFREVPTNLSVNEFYRVLSRRLRNVTAFITNTLECNYPVNKSFKPTLLIGSIKRGMSVHTHLDEGDVNDTLLGVIIQEHQIQLLYLLKALIISTKHNFMRFLSIKSLQEFLTRTKNCDCFKLNSEYTETIYEVIKHWILNSGEHIDSITYEKIIKTILMDIAPTKASLQLNIVKVEHKSKKAKNKAIQEKIIKSSEDKTNATSKSIKIGEDICHRALVTLELLLKKVTLNVKQNTCAQLFETLVQTLLSISVNTYDPPYTSKKCRLMIYKVFVAIFDQHVATLDLSLAVNILALGEHHSDTEISNVCSEGLAAIEKLCQPMHPSLYINYEDERVAEIRRKENVDMLAQNDHENNSEEEMEELRVEASDDATVKEENSNDGSKMNGNNDVVILSDIVVRKSEDVAKLIPKLTEAKLSNLKKLSDGDDDDEFAALPKRLKLSEQVKSLSIADKTNGNGLDLDHFKDEAAGIDMLASFVDEINC